MNKEVKFNLDEDILFQIAMMTYSECNSEIATIYDHLGEEYGYSDLQDAKEYELKYEKDLLEKAIKQLQQENQELKEKQNYDLKWALKYDELYKENQELKKQLEHYKNKEIERINENVLLLENEYLDRCIKANIGGNISE